MAFILTLIGFFGIAGIQYFYLDKPVKGIVWFLTMGIFGLGTLIDLFTITGQVEQFNTNIELKRLKKKK